MAENYMERASEDSAIQIYVYYMKSVSGRGIIAGGTVVSGTIFNGDRLSVLTADGTWKNTVATMIPINSNQAEPPDRVTAGEQILFMLGSLKESDVKEGTTMVVRHLGRMEGLTIEQPVMSIAQPILDKVGQFLRAKGAGENKSELETIVDELESQYKKALVYYEQHPMEDPAFHYVVGMAAYALAIYDVEVCFYPGDAENYATSARTHLKEYLNQFSNTLNEVELKSIQSAHDQSCEYAAYIAYYNGRYREVVPLLSDVNLTTTALGLTGAALALVADMENNSETSRAALSILAQMDSAIKAPADNAFVEDVYRSAYIFYAMMLATNADRFPGAGFVKDLSKAIYILHRGISLLHDEQYIAMLQEDIDKYSARLAAGG